MGVLDLTDRLWPVVSKLSDAHVALYRRSGGRVGHRVPGMGQVLLLDHVGARSGRPRTTPLIYAADEDDLVVVASKGGHPQHPAWFHNLRAHPDITVQVGADVRPVRARVATAAERPRLWAAAQAVYPTYDSYRQRTEREIPVVVLERRAGGAS